MKATPNNKGFSRLTPLNSGTPRMMNLKKFNPVLRNLEEETLDQKSSFMGETFKNINEALNS